MKSRLHVPPQPRVLISKVVSGLCACSSFHLANSFVSCVASAGADGDMLTFINRIQPVQEVQAKTIMWQLLNAVAYMHNCEPPVVHRDIKPDNVSS